MIFSKKKWASFRDMQHLTPHTIATTYIDRENTQLSLIEQGQLLGISRNSLYYHPVPVSPRILDLMHRIDRIHTDWPTYGARTIAAQLTKDTGISVGRKLARSLMQEMAIEAIYSKPHLSTNTVSHPVYPYLLHTIQAARPNHIWGTDITYIKMKHGFVYLAVYIDWYSRFILSWKLSTSLDIGFVLQAAEEALSQYGHPEIQNSDQGVHYTSTQHSSMFAERGTKISMDHKGRCFDNIFTERFWRTLKYEEIYLKDYISVREAEQSIALYMKRYNYERLHQALNYKTPAEVYFVN